jgi:ribosomal protein S18 acetylase RimI-like enzyme
MSETAFSSEWYHGSPHTLQVLRAGSTITQNRRLAEVFSHKPEVVSIDDDGVIQHNGSMQGYLYLVLDVRPEDVTSHPHTTMQPGLEWITARDLNLAPLGATTVSARDLFSEEQIAAIRDWALRKQKRLLDNNFRIRSFNSLDQVAIRQLVLEGLGERWGYIDETRNPDIDDITGHYVSRGHVVLIAEDDTGLLGTGTLVVEDGAAHMVRVTVKLTERCRGIASAIVEELVEIARERAVRRIEVETNNDWYSAIRLYERHGFVEYDRDIESVYLAKELVK